MSARSLSNRVETLIDELIADGGLDSASLAAILVAAQESVHRGFCLELSRQVWLAANALRIWGGDSDLGVADHDAPAGAPADRSFEEA